MVGRQAPDLEVLGVTPDLRPTGYNGTMADLAPGDLFAGHRIETVAGRGGMGVVYRAVHLALERVVALKLIAPAFAGDPEFRARFVRESRAAASIDHPNVIPIFSAGEEQDVLYISMRFVEGHDLRALIHATGRLEPRRAARIVAQVAAALDAAHERGLVHRDVKPANILLTPADHAYLTDFGLTKRADDGATRLSTTGGLVGTAGYVAPEQIRGERVDARTDVYSLGCVLFHTLTGRTPFAAPGEGAMLAGHLQDAPPSTGNAAFDEVMGRALAKDPDDRYPSAGDLGRAALSAAGEDVTPAPERQVARGAAAPEGGDETVASGGTLTAPTAAAAGAARGRGRGRVLALAAGAAVLLAAAVVAVVALAGGGGGGGSSDTATTRTTPRLPAAPARVAATVNEAVNRPNAIAIAGGEVWAAGFTDTKLVRVNPKSAKVVGSVRIPTGTTSMAAGRGRLWLTNQPRAQIIQVSVAGHRRVNAPIQVAGRPVAIAVTKSAIWVGSRAGAGANLHNQLLLKLDPATGALLTQVLVSRGIQNLTVGDGAVWITNRFSPTVTRVDMRTGAQRTIRVGNDPQGVDVAGHFAWVACQEDQSVYRIDTRSNAASPIDVGLRPRGVAVNRFAVWVSGYSASELVRIDPERARVVGRPLETALNPFKLALSGHELWLAATGENALQRVDF
jgi:streptogramin lyase